MSNRHRREEWLRDIDERQRNSVFPDTARNEARFWRNLSETPWKTSTLVGMIILAAFVCTWLGIFVFAGLQSGVVTALALAVSTLLLAGSLFVAIAWATRRSLKEAKNATRHPHTKNHE